jgi:hypothetical protein
MARDDPGPLGAPPDDIHGRDLVVVEWPRSLVRVHPIDRDPVFFGRTGLNRFDDPLREYGVLYAAEDELGAFIETYGTIATVTSTALAERALSMIATSRSLRLADLRGHGLARIGADARLFAGAHADAQRWSRAVWSHPAQVDGLCYPARRDPSRLSFAVYSRAAPVVAATDRDGFLSPANRPLAARILDHYKVGLIDA